MNICQKHRNIIVAYESEKCTTCEALAHTCEALAHNRERDEALRQAYDKICNKKKSTNINGCLSTYLDPQPASTYSDGCRSTLDSFMSNHNMYSQLPGA